MFSSELPRIGLSKRRIAGAELSRVQNVDSSTTMTTVGLIWRPGRNRFISHVSRRLRERERLTRIDLRRRLLAAIHPYYIAPLLTINAQSCTYNSPPCRGSKRRWADRGHEWCRARERRRRSEPVRPSVRPRVRVGRLERTRASVPSCWRRESDYGAFPFFWSSVPFRSGPVGWSCISGIIGIRWVMGQFDLSAHGEFYRALYTPGDWL